MLLQNATAFIDGQFRKGTNLLLINGQIRDIGSTVAALNEPVLNLNGDWLLPGLVDAHIHAYLGQDVMKGEQAVRCMSRELKKIGVAAFLPTTMSACAADTKKALKGIQAVMDSPEPNGAVVLGAHMEAPFLNDKKAGAQVKAHFTCPSLAAWWDFVGDYESIVRIVTMAPELPGAPDFIRYLCQRGITVSLGHTNADAETVHAAASNGATHVTHTFNAQTALNHRAPGAPGAAMVDDRLYCEFIGDGIHLHPDVVQMLLRCKGAQKAVAITDAMEAAGMPDGAYQLGGQAVFVQNGVAQLADGTLAGSTLTMHRAFQNLIRFGVQPEIAASVCTSTPARSIGNHAFGVIAIGAPAVFARFTPTGEFVETIG